MTRGKLALFFKADGTAAAPRVQPYDWSVLPGVHSMTVMRTPCTDGAKPWEMTNVEEPDPEQPEFFQVSATRECAASAAQDSSFLR
jgi:hypothetical protein